METFFGRYKNPLVLAIVLVAQFFVLAVQVKRPFPAAAARVDQDSVRALRYGVASVVTPPESVLHKSGLSFRNVWSSYLDLVGVREENTQLKEQIEQLRMEQAALAEDARQGERLQDLLAFRQNYINATVPAQVIGTSGTDRSRVLYLDKGTDDGIAADMPVITPDGIVGRVREVYPHTSQVLEISDPTSASGVLLEETRTRGILRGNAQGQPQIVNLMPDDRIKPGQVVLTSGGDQIFPRGLPVGVVDHIAPDLENEPMVDVVLKPAANLSRLEEVLVVTGIGPAPTERARRNLSKSELVAAGVRAAKEQGTSADVAAQIAEVERASEVLAERLPSRKDAVDPYAPDATPDSSPATTEAQAKPLHPPAALHADHYTPGAVPSAESLTPGQRLAPLAEGTAATERRTAKAGSEAVNATDNAPVGTNAAFSAAASAMAAQRKAAAETKAAAAARQYAAEHPGAAPPASSAPAAGTETADASVGAPAAVAPAVRYTDRVNADGTVTRVPVPVAKPGVLYAKRVNADGSVSWVPAPASASVTAPTQFTERINADGTVARVPVPAPTLYIARVNADGTIAHVPATAANMAPPVHYVNRTNADGTVTRVAMPAASPSTAGVTYTNRTNADGTVTRVPVPAASTASVAHYTLRTNADGTVTRVPIPATSASAVTYTNRTNADGTVTRVAVPAASTAPVAHYTLRTNADGTVTRVPIPAPTYTNRTNADGTVTRVPVPSGNGTPGAASSGGSPAAPRYTNRTNADGTVTRVPVPTAGVSAPAATNMNRVNADGTVTRVSVPSTAAGATAAPRYTTRTNADGTVTRVLVPGASSTAPAVRYTTRTNPDGTVTRVPVPASAGTATAPAQPKAATTPAKVTTHVVADGPLPAGSRSASTPRAGAAATGAAGSGTGAGSGTETAAPKRKAAPVLVPDDGSRPPAASKPANPAPQEQH